MRLLVVVFCVLLLCACSSGKPQYIPPPKPLELEPVVQAEQVAAKQVEPIAEPEPVDEKSFLSILMQEGTPAENIIPRSKEQVAVYQKTNQVHFYYFKRNVLILHKNYPAADIELIKASGNYPDSILREMGIIE